MPDSSVLEVVWPGVSTLLGALAGGGVTLWATHQQQNQDKNAQIHKRRDEIRDRSFNACVDVIRTASLLYNETNSLWFDLGKGESVESITRHELKFNEALTNHYAANSLARMTVPPNLKAAFDEYISATRDLSNEVAEWKVAYLQSDGSGSGASQTSSREDRCEDLKRAMVEKRDRFARDARTLFAESVWDG